MQGIFRSVTASIITIAALFCLNGCATLEVTPMQTPKAVSNKQPYSIAVLALGGRMQEVLTSPEISTVNASLAQSFARVQLLPSESSRESAADILKNYGADYVYTTSISDVSVAGNLNPYWAISFPILIFKPFAPIVTFEATVTLDNSVVDAHTSKVILQRQSTAVVTDHFSPMNPQDKVRNLVSRGINNSMVDFLDEFTTKISAR